MSKGFSLLELLVVIGVIGMLAAISLPNFMSARERARDAQRKSDLIQIQKALELYKLDQNPPAFLGADGSFSYLSFPNTGAVWRDAANTTTYMNKVPGDPNAPYYYTPDNTALTYTLGACLENEADTEGQDCSALAGYSCDSNKCFIVNEP